MANNMALLLKLVTEKPGVDDAKSDAQRDWVLSDELRESIERFCDALLATTS